MDTTTTSTVPTDGGPPAGKKKPSPAAGYKAMVKKPSQLAADTTKPLSPSNPLMVQKADGSVSQWGNPLPDPKNTPPTPPKQLKMSDKANGNSSTYYRANQ